MRILARIGLDVDSGGERKAAVRRASVPAVAALLAIGLLACGGSGSGGSSNAAALEKKKIEYSKSVEKYGTSVSAAVAAEMRPAPLNAKVDADHDNDVGSPSEDTNNDYVLNFGRPASAAERSAITALVKRYYATALAGDGARGCAMVSSTIAETAVEDDVREPGGPPYMHGLTSCAQVLHALFAHYHAQLAAELPKLQVTRVRLEEHHGFAFLRFGALSERKISVQRERHTWKMSQMYDEELP